MSAVSQFTELCQTTPLILPSLLLCDFGNLEREVHAVEEAGARVLHLDIMDGHFVPNITYGFTIIEAVRRVTDLPLDVHLMISNPEPYVKRFVDTGATLLSIHVEAVEDPQSVLGKIRENGAVAGLVLNPPTPVSAVEPYLAACDYILAMTVMPGYGGQEFDETVLAKVRLLRELLPKEVPIEVDGGVNQDTIASCSDAGAEMFVAGSSVFRTSDYAHSIRSLRELAVGTRLHTAPVPKNPCEPSR